MIPATGAEQFLICGLLKNMISVDDIARDIVRREGGFVNDPDDPGGPTNLGVTLGTLQRLGIDVDRDGDVDLSDLKRLTEAQAVMIFKDHYFSEPGIAWLPEPVQPSVFDMYVNAGSNAVKILQRVLDLFGRPVAVDGKIGNQTARAAAQVHLIAPNHFADAYGIARRNYYYKLADRRAASRKYARRRDGGKGGWIVRAEEFIAPKYHYTDADHKRRISAWD